MLDVVCEFSEDFLRILNVPSVSVFYLFGFCTALRTLLLPQGIGLWRFFQRSNYEAACKFSNI